MVTRGGKKCDDETSSMSEMDDPVRSSPHLRSVMGSDGLVKLAAPPTGTSLVGSGDPSGSRCSYADREARCDSQNELFICSSAVGGGSRGRRSYGASVASESLSITLLSSRTPSSGTKTTTPRPTCISFSPFATNPSAMGNTLGAVHDNYDTLFVSVADCGKKITNVITASIVDGDQQSTLIFEQQARRARNSGAGFQKSLQSALGKLRLS